MPNFVLIWHLATIPIGYSDCEKEYDLGNVITMNQTGKISRALHFNTAKLIIVRTLEYSSLSEEQLEARLDYIQVFRELTNKIGKFEPFARNEISKYY